MTTPGIYPKGAVPAHRASYNGALHEGERADCRLCDVHEATHQPESAEPAPATTGQAVAADDAQAARQQRRDALRDLITRVGRGRTGADIATHLATYLDAEQADADAERAAHEEHRCQLATALGETDGRSDWPSLLRRVEQVVTARITWKNTAAEIEADRDRLAADLDAAREKYRAGLRKGDEKLRELNAELERYADGTERPVLWSVYNRMHIRAATAEATLARVRDAVAEAKACGGEDAGCTVDHRDIITNLIDNGTAALGDDQPTPDAAKVQHCCVCGSTHVAYRNYQEQPFCGPCAGCGCDQTPCVRTGINDPAVSSEAAAPEPEPEPLRIPEQAARDLYTALGALLGETP